ncbi:arginase [Psychroflexus sp. CAK57W]|uniref:arginase n=1 Tax=Psychroflexus curvus TaxID=2873595 RepID=UPI001CCD8654|nr:arginase [Psychroflexus curvus]MBZ9787914.1 arginase [Psychroflexus curvus]
MTYFKFSDAKSLSKHMHHDSSGKKFGEKVITVTGLDQLESNEAEYVLFGIPTLLNSSEEFELGHFDMFQTVLKSLLNIQHNEFNRGENLIVLGELDSEVISEELNKLKTNPPAFLGRAGSEKINLLHSILEKTIYKIVQAICASGKIPIAIGGQHSNTFDLIKGVSLIKKSTVSLLDISTRVNVMFENNTDHLKQNKAYFDTVYINKHHTFGIHKNYVSQENLDVMNSSKNLGFYLYEDCLHLTTLDKCIRFKNAVDFLNRELGFKLDLKSIQGLSSCCDSSSGFSVRDIRTFLKVIRKEQAQFFHICGFEANQKESIGYVLSYFISDFIRNDD